MPDETLTSESRQPRAVGPEPRVGPMPRRPSEQYVRTADPDLAATSWNGIALIAIFIASIALPLCGLILGLDSSFTFVENRTLAPRPAIALNRTELAEFPARFEDYFNDHFGFRPRLIHWLNIIKVSGLGVSPSAKVILGKDGWLYHGESYLDYYRAIAPFTQARLEKWRVLLEARQDWLAARGIPYLIVFVPIKSTIYPEHMPDVYNRLPNPSRLDQLTAHLQAHSRLNILDLREPLRAAKSQGPLYYRTDTHWNNRGAYIGYVKIMERLTSWFPALEPTPRTSFRDETFSEPGRNLAGMLAMPFAFWDVYSDLSRIAPRYAQQKPETPEDASSPRRLPISGSDVVYERRDGSRPRAVMFRDSFTTWLIPLLSEHFERIVYSWQHTFDRRLVEREHPDLVIQEMFERALMNAEIPSE